ncbi:MAG: dihydropteroate synthase [Candidatus Methanomethylophilaceae archaeon]|nr:dihydropteroate synthase [Candidatus Methanomethylophilaceae archaeon]
MGILNLTPDSFSDGGRWTDVDKALEHAFAMIDEGADIIDVGAESTRPGCTPVSKEEEWARLEPVLEELIPAVDVPVSVDTMKSEIAAKSISLGVDIINDVNGFRGEGMFDVCSNSDVDIIISHMYGSYDGMHDSVMGDDYKQEIKTFLDDQIAIANDKGISDDRIIVDPGIGFGKTPEQNLSLSKDCSFLGKEHRVLIGVSRKRFIRQYYPDMDVDEATAIVSKMAVESGASIVRVHNVKATVNALRL